MARLRLCNVNKTYFGGYIGAKNVSFEVGEGEIITILGGERSGKTSILKLISSLESPTSGTITIDGRDVSKIGEEELNITFATYDLPLFGTKSVGYNLQYPLSIRKVDKEKIDSRVASIASLFDIDMLLDEHVRYLSPSLKARVMLARAFMRESDFYLFDNILRDFSIADREDALEILSSILCHVRGGVIFATDRVEEVSLVGGDDLVVLSGGEMLDRGAIGTLYRDANALETMRLLSRGTYNELITRVEKDARGYYVNALARHDIEIDDVYSGKDIIVAFPMENVYMDERGTAGIVTKIYRSTWSDVVRVAVGDIEIFLSTSSGILREGVDVSLGVRDILLYDIRSERRIIGSRAIN